MSPSTNSAVCILLHEVALFAEDFKKVGLHKTIDSTELPGLSLFRTEAQRRDMRMPRAAANAFPRQGDEHGFRSRANGSR